MTTNPIATFQQTISTGANVQNATVYKGSLDGDIAVMTRIGDAFAPHANSTPDMRVYLDPGHIFNGTTLTEIGADTLGTVTNGSTSVAITGTVAGISGTMLVSGPGIPANTTATISGTTVTLSQAATGLASSPQTNAPLRFMQRSAVITAPVANSRIDRIVVSNTTGAVSVITGTPGVTPSPPAITAGNIPIAQVLLTTSTTAITNSIITDERDLTRLGMSLGTAAAENLGAAIVDDGSGNLTIGANAVTNAMLAQAAAYTFLGNPGGATATRSDMSIGTMTSLLNAMVGDSGSGGTKGMVPAPGAGTAAANKFLKADGTWAIPSTVTTSAGSTWAIDFGGLKIKGGSTVLTAHQTTAISFGAAFPTSCDWVGVSSYISGGGAATYELQVSAYNASGLSVYNSDGGVTQTAMWIAVGH